MGTHARPRRRVRTAALGTLAVGATLTGVGLTAAALDPGGAGLADGPLGSEPVNFAASGLGAPVPVANVSSLDGSSSVGKGVLVTGGGSGTNGAPAVETPSTGYDLAQVKSAEPIVAAAGKKAAKAASVSRVTPASNTASTIKTAVGSNAASGSSASGNSASGTSASAANAAPKTGAASGSSSAGGTSAPQLPSLDASLPISTALPVPSLPTLPTISNLSTTVSHAKTTLAGLLNEVAGLV
jgi:hypothetical protein